MTRSNVTADNTPPSRYEQSMVYDAVRQRIVMFGGRDGNDNNETWELGDPATYADLSVHADYPHAAVFRGQTLTYNFVASNAGPAASASSVTFPLSNSITFVGATAPSGWTVSAPLRTLPESLFFRIMASVSEMPRSPSR